MPAGNHGYIAAVGMFDGLHTGHIFVLGELRRRAAALRLDPMVITFANHPSEVLRPDNPVPLLMSAEHKRREIKHLAGIDKVEFIPFTRSFATMTAARFLTDLKKKGVRVLAMGFNNHIGSDRLDADSAAALGIIEIEKLPPCPDCAHASSSALRKAIGGADLDTAATLLGRRYTFRGTVVNGRHLGRTIGFPTANIAPENGSRQLLPPDGAYAADITVGDDPTPRRAIVNIGIRPTVDTSASPRRTIEAHILDFHADIYGSDVKLTFLRRLRPERRFPSIDALRAQLALDAQSARNL